MVGRAVDGQVARGAAHGDAQGQVQAPGMQVPGRHVDGRHGQVVRTPADTVEGCGHVPPQGFRRMGGLALDAVVQKIPGCRQNDPRAAAQAITEPRAGGAVAVRQIDGQDVDLGHAGPAHGAVQRQAQQFGGKRGDRRGHLLMSSNICLAMGEPAARARVIATIAWPRLGAVPRPFR